ncbi:CD4-1 molecule [Acanthopagrus latus]|uniref:CD4-1 molecule n=1 Tax=Acanthopagrus latus TaxID=8177 RepID=UPI00187C7E26|nr:CD4-1 molecule [Acanthopagrus latus]XP_036930892.1 CD4-1 molecule [Acanthopagrus latus]
MSNSILPALLLLSVFKSMTGADEVLYAQVGETVSLKPPQEYTPSVHYLYWYFGDLELAWRNPHGGSGINDGQDMAKWKDKLSWSGNSLIIKEIPEEQFGTFTCKLPRDKLEKNYKLLKVQVSMNPASPLLPGDRLSLTCEADRPRSSKDEPKIQWLNPQGENVNNNSRHTVTATQQHNGEWTCVVANDNKEKRSTITVTVVDLSPAPDHPLYTSKFQSLTIPCSIPSDVSWEQVKAKGVQGVHWDYLSLGSSHISGDPQRLFSLSLNDTLSWQPDKNRGLTPVSSLMKGNLSLFINKAKVEDRGDYVCTMKFRSGLTLNRMVQVNVLQITSSPGTDLISGQQLNLTCSLGRPLSSDLQLKLIPPKQSHLQPLTSDREPALLNIPEVGTGDGGRWKCELWQRGILLTFVEITLKIEPKLSVWMLIIICSVTVIVLLVLVLVFILCHRRQRKMRHLRHRLCHCKNPKPKGFYRT